MNEDKLPEMFKELSSFKLNSENFTYLKEFDNLHLGDTTDSIKYIIENYILGNGIEFTGL